MRINVKKPIAILLSALMLLTMLTVGLTPPIAFAGSLSTYVEGNHHWSGVALGGARYTALGADEVSVASANFSTDVQAQNREMDLNNAPIATYYTDVNAVHTLSDLTTQKGFKLNFRVTNKDYCTVMQYLAAPGTSGYTSSVPSLRNIGTVTVGKTEDFYIYGPAPETGGQVIDVPVTMWTYISQGGSYIYAGYKLRLRFIGYDNAALAALVDRETAFARPADAYTAESYGVYSAALSAANAQLSDETPLQADIDAALSALSSAVDGLVFMEDIDYTALYAALADALELNAADYRDFSGVTQAFGNAVEITGKTQTEIDDLTDALQKEMLRLENKDVSKGNASQSVTIAMGWPNVYSHEQLLSVSNTMGGESASYSNGQAGGYTTSDSSPAVTQNATAYITVDRSLYTDLNQTGVGFMHILRDFQGGGYRWADLYVSGGTPSRTDFYNNTTVNTGTIYQKAFTVSAAIPAAGESSTVTVTSRVADHPWNDSYNYGSDAVITLTIYGRDKGALRTAVNTALSARSNYTPESYAAYLTALEAAVSVLNDPQAAQSEIDAATAALQSAINGLQTTITIDGNGGTVSPATLNVTVGSNTTAAFPESDVTATRAGYDLTWDKNTVTFNDTVTAQWTVRHDTAYTINNYYMNADGTYPDTPETQTFIGTTENTVTAADAVSAPANYALDADLSDASITIFGDGSAALNLYYARDSYTVAFDVDGTQTTDTLYYGAVPAYAGEAPALAATGENTYTFLGWTANASAEPGSDAAYYAANNLPPVTADVTYYPYFGTETNSYDITFTVDGADTVLSFPYGATPAFNGIPTKADDEANTYTFSGWSPAIEAVTGEAAYVAQFTATPVSYLVRATAGAGSTITDVTGIYNYNDTVDFTVTVAEGYTGTPVVSVNGTPVEATTANGSAYDYSVTVTGNTQIAVADLTKQTFTVKFVVDGAETEKTVAYGDTPAYGSVPAKAADAQYTYTFTGWSPEIVPATAAATYTAQFDPVLRSYDISFVTPDGTTTISVPYGETPAPGFTPAKAADAENTYEFAGWSTAADGEVAALAAVDGAATYYAIFTATPIPAAKYLVTVNPGVGSTISNIAGLYTAGTELTFTVTVDAAYSDSEPIVTFGDTVQQKTGKDGLVFSYALTVNADTEISVSDLTKNTYTITFNVEEDETTKTVSYGETPDAGFVPTKAQTTEYSYAFMGWNTAADGSGDPLAPATADETYYAVFTPTAIPAHTHSFDTLVRTVAATCVAGGYDEYICTCGMTEQRNPTSIAPANHAKDAILVGAREATETKDGYTGDLICPACGATITEGHVDPHTATPHVHSFDTLVSHADATCAAKAYDIYVCSCGEQQKVESGEVDPDNHAAAPMTVGQRDATTESYGYTGDVICPACDHVLSVGTVIEKLTVPHVHSFDTLIDSGEATCVAKAYTVYQCACGETERTETGEKNMNNHVGELKLLGAHAATATADGYSGDTYCLACGTMTEEGHVIDKLDPGHTHSYDTEIESAPATCIAKAYTIYQCECGDTKKVETGEKDAANHVGEIKLMGYHAATETADGYSGDKYCLACGELVEEGSVIPHTGSTTPDTPSTPDTPTNPDTPDDGGSNSDTRISFLDWLRNLIRKILSLFKIGGGEGSIC